MDIDIFVYFIVLPFSSGLESNENWEDFAREIMGLNWFLEPKIQSFKVHNVCELILIRNGTKTACYLYSKSLLKILAQKNVAIRRPFKNMMCMFFYSIITLLYGVCVCISFFVG